MAVTALDRVRAGLTGLDGQRVKFQSLFFVYFAAFSGIVVFRNVYLEEMGMSGSAMGQIGFLMTATGVLVQPLWGVVSDYFRAERPVLVVGAVGSAGGLLAYPLAENLAAPFLLVAAGTVVFSAFRAPVVPIANSWVLSRGYDYGKVRAFGSIAFGIGSLGLGLLVAAIGVSSIIWLYVVGAGVMVAVVWSVSEEPDGDGPAEVSADEAATDGTSPEDGPAETPADGDADAAEADIREAARRLLTNVDFLVVVGVAFLVGAALSGGAAFLSVYVRAVDASAVVGPVSLSPDAVTGVAWAVRTLFEAIAFVYAARLAWSYKGFVVVGSALASLQNLAYGLVSSPWVIVGVQVAAGAGYGLYYVAAVNLVHAVASERVSSTAQTVFTGAGFAFGGAVGQVIAGELTDLVGVQEMYLYLAAAGFLGAAVGLLVRETGTLADAQAT